jgi:hypothetical protein
MKTPAYSSLTAFLAHYRALQSAASRNADDDRLLAEMTSVLNTLPADELTALASTSDDPATRRHRERAHLHLSRELIARGIVAD